MQPSKFKRATQRCMLSVAIASVFLFAIAVERTEAHKPVTSKYDYNKDIFPLFQNYCSRCHISGGAAPMSLMTYTSAVPWAESIRDEVTAGRMPPWPVDPTSPPVKSDKAISPREIDRIVVWASGGTPEGNPNVSLPSVTYESKWQLGTPDLEIPMDAGHTVPSGKIEETCDFSLPVNLAGTKLVRAADLRPGNASIVRDAIISVENGPVLALWQPGMKTISAPAGAAFRLDAGSKLHLQIHYKKHFDQDESAVSDRSTIGLYFGNPSDSTQELQSLAIDSPKPTTDSNISSTFAGTLSGPASILAIRPLLDRAYAVLDVDAIAPSGKAMPLLRLRGPRPQWFQRYWLQEPIQLEAGSKVQVRTTPLSDDSDEPPTTRRFPLQVVLDFVTR